MLSFAKILLPVDFSGRCEGAARYAHALAGRFGSEVILAHVLPPPHYEFSALEVGGSVLNELFANRVAQVRTELDSYLSRELLDVKVRRVLLEGDPARRLVEFAHDEKVSLIMMPTHGYGSFRRFILGSVTAKVLHDADCPVWTGVHMEQAPPASAIGFGRIVVAVDLGPQSGATLQWAAHVAESFGAHLTVVHALQCLEPKATERAESDWQAGLKAEAAEQIRRLQEGLGTTAEVVLETGDAPSAVCGAAARLGAGVLVIGRGSAAGIFGRLRTNAYAIIRQSPCPVVSV